MEEEDNIIVIWVQEDVETSYNLLNKYIYIYIFYIYIHTVTPLTIYASFLHNLLSVCT